MSRPRVLFLCTGNACRSQMAEAWARALRLHDLEPCSAGTAPKGLDPRVAVVMAEVGIDVAGQTSKHVDVFLDAPLDLVISVCDAAKESCPVFPRPVPRRHAPFPDPPELAREAASEAEALDAYRRVRDLVRDFIRDLDVSDLAAGTR